MNRSHKHQLEKLRSKNGYTTRDLEIAKELLNQQDPPFRQEVEIIIEKITRNLNKERED
ncbi:hypothetical protein RJG79_05075 [Mycoplasmatota bacterium WC44]